MPEVKDRQFETDLVFKDRTPDNIRLGKSYRVKIELGQPERAVIVPRGDFYQHTGGKWIFRIDPETSTAHRVDIEIGRSRKLLKKHADNKNALLLFAVGHFLYVFNQLGNNYRDIIWVFTLAFARLCGDSFSQLIQRHMTVLLKDIQQLFSPFNAFVANAITHDQQNIAVH